MTETTSIPSATTSDEQWMLRALALARASAGLASPNPQVGCVLVAQPVDSAAQPLLLGEGAHYYADRDHAEIVALRQAAAAGHAVQGATAYVTLEPCSHTGRTGPCADALIAAGIGRCVVATVDPNPLVSGQGMARMREAGLHVTVGVREAEARALNLPFAHFIQHRRPFVTLKAALSCDDSLAPAAATRRAAQPHWLTGIAAREEVHRLRHAADAILTGIGTVLADNPALTDRSGLPRRRPLLRVVLDGQLRTPVDSKLIRSASSAAPEHPVDLLLLCSEDASLGRERQIRDAAGDHIEIRRVPASPAGHLALPPVLELLAERSCLSLLLETGSTLNSSFLHADLVDRAVLFKTPVELGAGAVPFAAAGPSAALLEHRLQARSERSLGPDRMITGLLHDPWAGVPASAWQPDHLG